VADYATAAEVFAAIAAREREVDARLAAVGRTRSGTDAFAASVAAARVHQRRERERLRARLGVAAGAAAVVPQLDAPGELARLRDAQQELVHAHAEGLPALGDRHAVDVFARHLVELAAQLTVIDLWIEGEE